MRLDARSWRLIGLAVGFAGLWWLWTDSGRTPAAAAVPDDAIVAAAWNADVAALAALVRDRGAANRSLDRRATRPLHVLLYGPACQDARGAAGVAPAVDLLLAAGADVNAADSRGTTPLMLAASRCPAPVVRRLLEAGADPQATSRLGLTAFEMTLARQSAGGRVLAESGFRLDPETLVRYQRIYHDEPAILAHLSLADPGAD